MPVRLLLLILSFYIFSCHPKKSPEAIPIIKNYDTLPNGQRLLDNTDSSLHFYYKEVVGSDSLKGGYITCYGIDDSMRYFYLRHGDTLHLLRKASTYVSAHSLGTLVTDYDSYFVTVIDNGNSTPQSYQVFDKKTGRNKLGDDTEFNSYQFLKDTLFVIYMRTGESATPDSVVLCNISTMKKQSFPLPADMPQFLEIQIGNLARNHLTISYMDFVSDIHPKTKTYKR